MELPLVGVAFLVVWFIAVVRKPERAFPITIISMPFGMTAIALLPAVGGLSLIASSVFAMLALGIAAWNICKSGLSGIAKFKVELIHFVSFLYLFYAFISCVFFVRFFEGEFFVFPLSPVQDGLRVSWFYRSTIVPIQPTKSNLSQFFYLVLSFSFFFLAIHCLRVYGTTYVHRALCAAGVVNLVLGFVDQIAAEELLAFFRTANYALANQQVMNGIPRVIGGFSEPAAFGAFTVGLTLYFFAHYVKTSKIYSAYIAIPSLFLVIATFSTTAYLGITVGCSLMLIFAMKHFLFGKVAVQNIVRSLMLLLIGFVLIAAMLVDDVIQNLVAELYDVIVLSKRYSYSGLERSAWAAGGIHTFIETNFLGAGVGSIRANGTLSVLLGSVGLIGTVLYLVFLFIVLFGPFGASKRVRGAPISAVSFSARISACSMIAMGLVSATSPAPSLPLMLMLALCYKERQTTSQLQNAL